QAGLLIPLLDYDAGLDTNANLLWENETAISGYDLSIAAGAKRESVNPVINNDGDLTAFPQITTARHFGDRVYTGISGLTGIGIGVDDTNVLGVEFKNMEHIELRLGDQADDFTIAAPPADATIKVIAGGGDDTVHIERLYQDTTVWGGDGDDTLEVADDSQIPAADLSKIIFDGAAHLLESQEILRLSEVENPDVISDSPVVYIDSGVNRQTWPDSFFPITADDLPKVNEIQEIYHNAASGIFTLSFDGRTTSAMPYNITANLLKGELEKLSSIGSGNIAVTGDGNADSHWKIEFIVDLEEQDVPQFTGNFANLKTAAGDLASYTIVTTSDPLDTFTVAPEAQGQMVFEVGQGENGKSYQDTILADNPLLYWSFDESDPAAAAIELVNGNSADQLIISGNASRESSGATQFGYSLGNAASFNGGLFQTANLSPTEDLNGPWAVEFWFSNETPDQPVYFADAWLETGGGGNTPGLISGYTSAAVWWASADKTTQAVSNSTPLTAGVWDAIAGTWTFDFETPGLVTS
ncbi:MAG: hypothetical protein GY850_08255, partial [bacterium]|nr:hypothetical protein [bacterium]